MLFDSLDQAVDYFSNEADCIRSWITARWPNGVRCPYCETPIILPTIRSRVRCKHCRKQINAFTRTPLQGTRLPIRHWLLVLWGMVQDPPVSGDVISIKLLIPRESIFRVRRIIRNIKKDFPLNLDRWGGDPFKILLRELTTRQYVRKPRLVSY